MNLKKYIYLIFILFGILIFSSCSNSDDEANSSNLIGKWYVVNVESSSEWGEVEEDMTIGDWIIFNEDMTCKWVEYGEIINAKYSVDNKILSIFDIDVDDYMPFDYRIEKLTADKLVLKIDLGDFLQGIIELER
ncbi:MAG: hypothetical protein IJ413_01915 [Bacteroides sp.]|nr:hypothetical protein [Bacteroides sp.]